jgi:hypothetical protein
MDFTPRVESLVLIFSEHSKVFKRAGFRKTRLLLIVPFKNKFFVCFCRPSDNAALVVSRVYPYSEENLYRPDDLCACIFFNR